MIIDNSIKVLAKEAVDERLLLTKEQMLSVQGDSFLPNRYLAICSDTDAAGLYLYDINNIWDSEGTNLGKFRLYEPLNLFTSEGIYLEDNLLSLNIGFGLKFNDATGSIMINRDDLYDYFSKKWSIEGKGLLFDNNKLRLLYDNDTIKVNSDGKLCASSKGTEYTAGPGVSIANNKISVNVDNDTIKINNNKLEVTPEYKKVYLGMDADGDAVIYGTSEKVTFNMLKELVTSTTPTDIVVKEINEDSYGNIRIAFYLLGEMLHNELDSLGYIVKFDGADGGNVELYAPSPDDPLYFAH